MNSSDWLSMKVQVFILGDAGSGKTSFVKSIQHGSPHIHADGSTEGVDVSTWLPEQQYLTSQLLFKLKHNQKEGEPLTIELWDTTGRSCCWPVLQTYFTERSVYVVMCDSSSTRSIASATELVKMICTKVPGRNLLVLQTRSFLELNQTTSNDDLNEILGMASELSRAVTGHIVNELNILRDRKNFQFTTEQIIKLENLLIKCSGGSSKAMEINFNNQERFEELMEVFLTMILKTAEEKSLRTKPPTANDETAQLLDMLSEHRRTNRILLPMSSLNLSGTNILINHMKFNGTIANSESVPESELICINPGQLANAMCQVQFDIAKEFKFEAFRFWPKDSGKSKPDPSLLVKALEELSCFGRIREVLFPLLWQDVRYSEEQIRLMIRALVQSGYVATHTPNYSNNMEELSLPNYPSLSTAHTLSLPLVRNTQNKKPSVNWSELTQEDDCQLDLEIIFPAVPLAKHIATRIITECSNSTQDLTTYSYLWMNGYLFKIAQEVSAHIQTVGPSSLLISSRCLNDESTNHLATLWTVAKHLLERALHVIRSYPCLIHQVVLRSRNLGLVSARPRAESRPSPPFPLSDCLDRFYLGQSEIERDGHVLHIKALLDKVTTDKIPRSNDWLDAIKPSTSLKKIYDSIGWWSGQVVASSQSARRNGRHKPIKRSVTWRSNISEEINMATREYLASRQPKLVSDKTMRQQIWRIAGSVVATAMSAALAQVITTQDDLSEKQKDLIRLVAGSVEAGSQGQTEMAVHNVLKVARLVNQSRIESEEAAQRATRSKLCVII